MYMAVFYTKIYTNNSPLLFSTVGSGPPWPQEELVQGHPVGKCGKTKAHRMTSTRRMWSSAWKTRSLSLARLLREKPPKRGPYGWRKAQCRGRTTIQMLWSNVSHIDYFECLFCGHGCILTLFYATFDLPIVYTPHGSECTVSVFIWASAQIGLKGYFILSSFLTFWRYIAEYLIGYC